jgi:hypothetical protein
MRPYYDLTRSSFGRLTVLRKVDARDTNGGLRWECRCECGKVKVISGSDLTRIRKPTVSCGCWRTERATMLGYAAKTHGLSKIPEYFALNDAINRCSPDCKDPIKRAAYFERGIIVCSEWRNPVNGISEFLKHVGLRPSKLHSLDRIDNDGNYEPGNVRWATRKEQASNKRNKRIEHFSNKVLLDECKRRNLL